MFPVLALALAIRISSDFFCKQCVNRGKPTDFILILFFRYSFILLNNHCSKGGLEWTNSCLVLLLFKDLRSEIWFVFHCFREIDFRSMFSRFVPFFSLSLSLSFSISWYHVDQDSWILYIVLLYHDRWFD